MSSLWRRCSRARRRAADLDEPELLPGFAAALIELRARGLLLAYHDRSDGGLLVTLLEMAFAGALRSGRQPGRRRRRARRAVRRGAGRGAAGAASAARAVRGVPRRAMAWPTACSVIGAPACRACDVGSAAAQLLLESLGRAAARLVGDLHRMRRLRDEPQCAEEEFAALLDASDRGCRSS